MYMHVGVWPDMHTLRPAQSRVDGCTGWSWTTQGPKPFYNHHHQHSKVYNKVWKITEFKNECHVNTEWCEMLEMFGTNLKQIPERDFNN